MPRFDNRCGTGSDTADCLLAQQVCIIELHIKVEGSGENARIAEFDTKTAAEWIPADMQVEFIKIADQFIHKD